MSRPLAFLGLGLVVAVAVWLAVGDPSSGPSPALEPPPNAVDANGAIVRVVDGDTVHVQLEGVTETVRLIGVDTPETVDERKPVQCFGPEATARTNELLPAGTPVRVERDAEARDQYGRLLAYVYRARDGLFINLALVREGFGVVVVYDPNTTHADELRAAGAAAQRNRLGLWDTCGGPGRAAAPSTTGVR